MGSEGGQLPAVRKDSSPGVIRRVGNAMLELALQHGIPLAKTTSELLATHKGRLDSMEALKYVYIEEGKAAAQVKSDLIKAAAQTTDPVARIQFLNSIAQVDQQIRTIKIGNQALPYIADPKPDEIGNTSTNDTKASATSEQWLDTFLHFARMRNESWRQDLLASVVSLK